MNRLGRRAGGVRLLAALTQHGAALSVGSCPSVCPLAKTGASIQRSTSALDCVGHVNGANSRAACPRGAKTGAPKPCSCAAAAGGGESLNRGAGRPRRAVAQPPAAPGAPALARPDACQIPHRPTVVLPLGSALAKLGPDPHLRLRGWEVRLLPGSAQAAEAASGRTARRGRGRPKAKKDGGSGSGSESDSDSGSGGAAGSLGRVEEVFAVTVTEASSGGASASSGTASQSAQRQEWLMRVVRESDAYAEAYGFVGAEEYVLKLDSALLPHADVGAQVLYAAPPPELLEQGRRHLLLQLLRSELRALLGGVEGTERGGSGGAEAGPSDKPAEGRGRGHRRKAAGGGGEAFIPAAAAPAPLPPGATLPSRKQLLEAGRRDLVERVAQAGGFAEVATHLGLRLARRPRGFWTGPGSWTRLGEELAVFVANSWLELPAPDEEGACYFFNQVSGRTTWRRPAPLKRLPATAGGAPGAGGVRWVVAEPAANRVMPSQTAVLQAGRYDLHNAIVAHGGYTAVAQHLGRRVTWALSTRAYGSRAALRRQLAAAAEELGLPEGAMPTQRELQEAGRGALLAAVRRSGGFQAVAGSLRLRPRGQRRPRGHWDDPERLAQELAVFAASTGKTASAPAPSSELATAPGPASTPAAAAPRAAAPEPTTPASGPQPASAPALPSRASLMAAGRMDLVYGMDRHRGRRGELAELAGLAPAASRRGTNRNALRLEDVRGALAAGCHTPKAIREHLEARGVSVSRQHLTTWLASRVEEGLLARAGHGRYRDAHEEAGEEVAG